VPWIIGAFSDSGTDITVLFDPEFFTMSLPSLIPYGFASFLLIKFNEPLKMPRAGVIIAKIILIIVTLMWLINIFALNMLMYFDYPPEHVWAIHLGFFISAYMFSIIVVESLFPQSSFIKILVGFLLLLAAWPIINQAIGHYRVYPAE
jgi:hypothetical protein